MNSLCLVVFLILQLKYVHLQQQQVVVNEEGMGLNDHKIAIKVLTRMNWHDANRFCEKRNARLITPYLLGHDFLHKILFLNLASNNAYWAGFNRPSKNADFEWVKAYEFDSYPELNGTVSSNADCGAIAYNNVDVAYFAKDCNEERPFICEKLAEACSDPSRFGFVEGPDKIYYFKVDAKATFTEAYKYCAVFDAVLPSITNKRENDYITQLARTPVRSIHGYWLGAHRFSDDDWQWYDRAPMCFNNWSNYTTPTATESSNRLVMWSNQARAADPTRLYGTWAHQDATVKQGIICSRRCRWTPTSCKD